MQKRLLSALAFLALPVGIVLSLAAQQPPPAAQATAQTTILKGAVHTAAGVAVPGATLRLVDSTTGQAWMTWTDENGGFTLPGLPAGHYRAEVSQLGFATSTTEAEVGVSPPTPPLELSLKVGSLTELTQPAAGEAPAPSPVQQQTAAAAPAEGTAAVQNAPANQTTPRAGRGGLGGAGGGAGRGGFGRGGAGRGAGAPGATAAGPGGGRGFQAVNLNAANGAGQETPEANNLEPEATAPLAEADALGQAAASSDAFLMNGTVGQGDTTPGAGGFGPPGGDFGGPGGLGGLGGLGPGGQAGIGGAPAVPGFPAAPEPGGAGNFAGPVGGPGGFGGGGGGGGGRGGGGGGGGGGRGGGGGPGRGGAGRGGGQQPLFGLARLAQQRANRIRFGLSDDYTNSAFDARPYSLSGTTSPKTGSWQETLGGTMGGPLRIPKVYDGSDRTFFFLNFSVARGRSAVDQYSTVPTAAERQGDFSDRGAQLYDPFSNLSGPRTSWGSVIPSGMLNPTAVALLQYIPEPNLPGLVQNYLLQSQVPSATNRFSARINQTISPKVHLDVTYNFQGGDSHSLQSFSDFERNQSTRGQSVTLGLTENFSRTFIHTSTLYFTRNRSLALNQFAYGQDIAGELGITGISTAPVDYGVPQLSFTNFTGASDPVPSLSRNQTLRFVDSIRLTTGKHSITAGAEIRQMSTNTSTNPTPRGAFTFSGALTSQLDASGKPVPGTGLDFADFLLGLPISTNVRFGTPSTYFRNWGYAGYGSDDWRVTTHLSLTVGVRYEAVTPLSELYGHIANLIVNPNFTQAVAVVPGVTPPFGGSLPSALINGDYNNWSPRVGLAWRPPIHHQVTVRAGYSLMYNGQAYNGLAASLASQPPWADAQTLQSGASQLLTLENGFPAASPNALTNTIAIDPNYKLAYAQIWNLSVETPLFRNLPFAIIYTGTKGTHLDTLMGFSNSSLAAAQGSAIQNAQGFTYDTSGSNSIFHALQVRTQGRLTRNIRLGVNYTFSKSIDDASSIGGGQQVIVQDNQDLAAQRGLSSFDVRHKFNANFGYDLPFGERQRFARSGLGDTLLGNWTLTNTVSMQSGSPFTARVFNSACQILPGVYSERANQIGNTAGPQTVQEFFNTAAFAVPTGACIGDAGRNTIIGPGSFTLSTDLGKIIRIGRDGQKNLQIHWQVNNLTNTPNFTALSTVVNSSTFGRVTGVSGMRTMTLHLRMNF